MTKLKCWKKIDERKDYIHFRTHAKVFGKIKKGLGNKEILINKNQNDFWNVLWAEDNYSSPGNQRTLKTKTEALNFANKYMKSHDKC